MDCVKKETDEEMSKNETKSSDVVQQSQSKESNNNYEPNKESNSSGGGDIESVQSDGVKTAESREDRIRRLKEKTESERLRKYAEIVESQRQSSELRQRQQEDRRRKIEELKAREDERKKKVEQRRLEMESKDRERNEGLLRRTREREARAAEMHKSQLRTSMTQSVISPRMTTSIRSREASSGSDKCTGTRRSKVIVSHNRSSSLSGVVDGSGGSCRRRGHRSTYVPLAIVVPPINTRHAGCFIPYRGTRERVRGVLAWGPPPDRDNHKHLPLAWWEAVGGPHKRTASAHTGTCADGSRARRGRQGYSRKDSSRSPRHPVTDSHPPQALYDRLSRPRGGSQPPKTSKTVTMTSSMTASITRPPPTTAAPKKTAKTITGTPKKPAAEKSAPDSGLTASPASETVEHSAGTGTQRETDVSSEPTTATATEEAPPLITKASPAKVPAAKGQPSDSGKSQEEEEAAVYRQKLADQRRLAREAKERQQEEQRRLEEAAWEQAELERCRVEEEARLAQEEEERRRTEAEEELRAETERQRLQEDEDRIKKEDEEREQEERRLEKLRLDDNDRMERKRRLEKIMSRVKKADDSAASEEVPEVCLATEDSLASGASAVSVVESVVSIPPRDAWPEEPAEVSETVQGLQGPEPCTESPEPGTEPQPQFKSRLLQSMIAGGRLSTASGDGRRSSLAGSSQPSLISSDASLKRHSLLLTNGDLLALPHSRSFNCDIGQTRTGLSYEGHHGDGDEQGSRPPHHSDTENEATISSLGSQGRPSPSPEALQR